MKKFAAVVLMLCIALLTVSAGALDTALYVLDTVTDSEGKPVYYDLNGNRLPSLIEVLVEEDGNCLISIDDDGYEGVWFADDDIPEGNPLIVFIADHLWMEMYYHPEDDIFIMYDEGLIYTFVNINNW
ncbi:MAG: hypothetical protein CW338_01040 [Clostridiales bacterium]|nr:hypothetical protein [Clostridiales bacterium]